MVSILFDEEYARKMREKALVEEVWEELPFVLQGIRQGLSDEEINEKFRAVRLEGRAGSDGYSARYRPMAGMRMMA